MRHRRSGETHSNENRATVVRQGSRRIGAGRGLTLRWGGAGPVQGRLKNPGRAGRPGAPYSLGGAVAPDPNRPVKGARGARIAMPRLSRLTEPVRVSRTCQKFARNPRMRLQERRLGRSRPAGVNARAQRPWPATTRTAASRVTVPVLTSRWLDVGGECHTTRETPRPTRLELEHR